METEPHLLYERAPAPIVNYNALQLNLTKRFSKNLALTVAYTWSKSLDNTNGLLPLQDNYAPTNNYALSNFDRTNTLTISHVWQLPFGAGTNHLSNGVFGHILGPGKSTESSVTRPVHPGHRRRTRVSAPAREIRFAPTWYPTGTPP